MKLFFATITIGGWTLLSRILGFMRDMTFAFIVGASTVADAFFVAFRFPNIFRALFAEGVMNAVFVPFFTREHLKSRATAQRFTQRVFTLLVLWILFFIITMILFMKDIMLIQAKGFSHDAEKFTLTVELAKILFPYLGFMVLNALFTGVLNALGKFALSAAMPCFLNIAFLIILALIYAKIIPLTGYEIAIGVVISAMVQCIILLWACRKAGITPYGFHCALTPRIKMFFAKALPVIFGASVLQINIFISTIFATSLEAGTVSHLYYADRLVQLPLGVVGIAVGVALLPMLTNAVVNKDTVAIEKNQSDAIAIGLFLALPATVALLVLAVPIIHTLFMHGAFDALDAQKTALVLQTFAVGLPAFVLLKIVLPTFFARGDTSTPMKVAFMAMLVYILLALLLRESLSGAGLALATSISAWCNVSVLYIIMKRRNYETFSKNVGILAVKIFFCSSSMGGVLWIIVHFFHNAFIVANSTKFFALLLLIFCGKVVYFSMLLLTKTLTKHHVKLFLLRRK